MRWMTYNRWGNLHLSQPCWGLFCDQIDEYRITNFQFHQNSQEHKELKFSENPPRHYISFEWLKFIKGIKKYSKTHTWTQTHAHTHKHTHRSKLFCHKKTFKEILSLVILLNCQKNHHLTIMIFMCKYC